MKAIEQTSLALLSASLMLLVFVVTGYAFDRYTTREPLFIPPPENKDFSYVKSLREATSLEGVKKTCTFWAEREDQSRQFVTGMYDRFKSTTRELIVGVVVLGAFFSMGLLYIYLMARRLQRLQRNAL